MEVYLNVLETTINPLIAKIDEANLNEIDMDIVMHHFGPAPH